MSKCKQRGALHLMAMHAKNRIAENDYERQSTIRLANELPVLERELFERIMRVIERENELANPIAELVCNEQFYQLKETERQRELFKMSALYFDVRNRVKG